jgi:hypothetical protein
MGCTEHRVPLTVSRWGHFMTGRFGDRYAASGTFHFYGFIHGSRSRAPRAYVRYFLPIIPHAMVGVNLFVQRY